MAETTELLKGDSVERHFFGLEMGVTPQIDRVMKCLESLTPEETATFCSNLNQTFIRGLPNYNFLAALASLEKKHKPVT